MIQGYKNFNCYNILIQLAISVKAAEYQDLSKSTNIRWTILFL